MADVEQDLERRQVRELHRRIEQALLKSFGFDEGPESHHALQALGGLSFPRILQILRTWGIPVDLDRKERRDLTWDNRSQCWVVSDGLRTTTRLTIDGVGYTVHTMDEDPHGDGLRAEVTEDFMWCLHDYVFGPRRGWSVGAGDDPRENNAEKILGRKPEVRPWM